MLVSWLGVQSYLGANIAPLPRIATSTVSYPFTWQKAQTGNEAVTLYYMEALDIFVLIFCILVDEKLRLVMYGSCTSPEILLRILEFCF